MAFRRNLLFEAKVAIRFPLILHYNFDTPILPFVAQVDAGYRSFSLHEVDESPDIIRMQKLVTHLSRIFHHGIGLNNDENRNPY